MIKQTLLHSMGKFCFNINDFDFLMCSDHVGFINCTTPPYKNNSAVITIDVPVYMQTADGTYKSQQNFQYRPNPVITNVYPNMGPFR